MGAFIKTLLHTICTMTQILFNRRGALLLIIINIFIISPRQSHASVIFSTILLMDSSSFSAKAFSSLVLTLTNATSITLHSVESDTITGVQGKSLFFFAPSLLFYNFQLLHVTRARSSIEVEDEKTASAIIRLSLPHEALIRKSLTVGIESVEIGEADVTTWQRWLTTTYLELPPFAAQYLVVGWALTVLGFLACVVCYCCCCKKGADDGNNVQTIASVVMHPPPAAAVPVQQQKPSIPSLVQPSAPPKIPSAPPQTVVGPTVKTSTAATAATTPPVPLSKVPVQPTTNTTTTPLLPTPGKPAAAVTSSSLPLSTPTKKPETDSSQRVVVQVESQSANAPRITRLPSVPNIPPPPIPIIPPMLQHRRANGSFNSNRMESLRQQIRNKGIQPGQQ